MITLTENAAGAVRSAIAGAAGPIAGLRIATESGGCAGVKYIMGLVRQSGEGDLRFERNGLTLFIDRFSVDVLDGTTIDFVTGELGAGFVFESPRAAASCSCGKSFG